MITSHRDLGIEAAFPAALHDGYELRSPRDLAYNCIAWAAGDTNIPWWPALKGTPGVYWPEGVLRRDTVEAFVSAYKTVGYRKCKRDGRLERGYEKIALYVDPKKNKPTHAARQLANGVWTSKLGPYRDIHHTSVCALESSTRGDTEYGRVILFMKRRRLREHRPLCTPTEFDNIPDSMLYENLNLLRRLWNRLRGY